MSRVKVVLKEAVEKVGVPGEIVTVAGGFARNYLIPRGLAVPANKGNLKQAENWKSAGEAAAAKQVATANELKASLEKDPLVVSAQAGPDGKLFGSVTPQDITQAIAKRFEIEIDRHVVELSEPIRSLGVHTVRIPLHAEVSAEVSVEVRDGSST